MTDGVTDIRLVVGLGNPGTRYAGTRHNIGFDVVAPLGDNWKMYKKVNALVSEARVEGRPILLCMPQTFMNLSGQAVLPFVAGNRWRSDQVLVLHDELDVPFGRIKLKIGGGDAGHNGLRSITAGIGSDYYRMRLGIGRPYDGTEIVDYVLRRFDEAQQGRLQGLVAHAGELVTRIVKDGLAQAQAWHRLWEQEVQ